MTAEQLERARAERLRHNGNAALTIEEAKTWLEETGLCLYLPRPAQIPTLAPSFAEAVEGKQNPTPGKETLTTAASLLTRLVADGVAIPLNLLTSLGEQPDFLVATWVLPYVFALRGERDWRRPPQTTGSRKVSQLSVEVIRILEAEGPLTTSKLKTQLGREVTEAATLRAIDELWSELRIYPEPQEGKACEWHLLKTKHMKSMQEGASTSQVTAISVLASIYLPAVIAATSEEVEIFLSPLTSRSKIREVLRGLTATRQINTLSLSAQSFYFVAGTLPEFPVTLNLPTYVPVQRAEQEREYTPTLHPVTSTQQTTPTEATIPAPKSAFKPAARAGSSTNGWIRPARPIASRGADSRGNFPPRRKEGAFPPKREGGFAPRTPRPDSTRPIRAFPGGPILNAPAAVTRPGAERPTAPPSGGARPLRAFPGGPILNAPATTPPAAASGARPVRAYPGGPVIGGATAGARPSGSARPAARPASGRPSSGRPNSRPRSASGARPPARAGHPAVGRPTGRPTGTRPPHPAGTRSISARPSVRPTGAKSGKPMGARPQRPGTARPAAAGRTNSRPNTHLGSTRPSTKPSSKQGTRPTSKSRAGRPAAGSRPSGIRASAARPAGARKPGARPGAKPGAKSGKFAGAGGKKRS